MAVAMEKGEELKNALDQLLKAFSGYYNINLSSPAAPFAAEAVFSAHDEQYFLVKAARLTDYNTSEHVFFALEDQLTAQRLAKLDLTAWETGILRADPGPKHRATDVGLCILTGHLTDEAAALVPKLKHSKSYRFGFYGYSQYRLVAYDLFSKRLVRNRMGDSLEKAIRNTL